MIESLEPRALLSDVAGTTNLIRDGLIGVESQTLDSGVVTTHRVKVEDKVSAFLRTAAERFLAGPTALQDVQPTLARINSSGQIQAYIRYSDSPTPILEQLPELGVDVDLTVEEMKVIQAWIPAGALDAVANLPTVTGISLPGYAKTNSVTTAGDAILRADLVRSRFASLGIDGSGIKVGIISDGVSHRANVGPDELPAITLHPSQNGSGDEGTAMAEIIHDIAPGASLFFSGPDTEAEMVNSINYFIGQGCKVIVDDLGFPFGPYFEDGPIAVAAANAVAAGVTYVTAAGNGATKHYQANYVQGPASDNGFYHNFSAADFKQDILMGPGAVIQVFLQWSDEWGESDNDYDLYLYNNSNGNVVASSTQGQNGNDEPLEVILFQNNSGNNFSGHVRVDKFSGAARELEMYIEGANSEYKTAADSAFGQSALPEALSIGAVDASDSGNNTVENFSSHGPCAVYDNFATQHRVLRDCIDGVAIDGVVTRVGQLGFFPSVFFGTSAAAPHVAGIAALMRDANLAATPAQISQALADTAVDLTAYGVGYDHTSGAGRFDALAAVYKVFVPPMLDLPAASDTGASDTDNITTVVNPTLNGTAPAGSFVRLFIDGVESATQQLGAAVTNFNFALSPLADGPHQITIKVSENASIPIGNVSNPSPALNLTIDTTAPAAPEITSITTDSGPSNADHITSDPTVILSGTADPNSNVSLSRTGIGQIGAVQATAGGTWSFDYTGTALAPGDYTFSASVVDLAGNASPDSSPFAVTIDTTAPAAPVITGFTNDTGISGTDRLTNDRNLFVNGTSEPHASIRVNRTGIGQIGTTTADADGNWSFDYTGTTLNAGVTNFTAVATDLAGNTGPTSSSVNVTIDFTMPAAPLINSIATDTGASTTDELTKDNTITLSGTSEANGTITVLRSDIGVVGTVAAVGTAWTFDYTATVLPDGAYSFTATTTDKAGNTGAVSIAIAVTIDATAPALPVFTSFDDDTGISSTDQITSDNRLVLHGTAEPSSSVTISRVGMGLLSTFPADGAGNWNFDYSSVALPHGDTTFTATALDAAGNTSAAASLIVTVDLAAPTSDIIDVAPDPRDALVDSIAIDFSEPVVGLDLLDLSLSRNGGANLLSAAQSLSSADGIHVTLLGLSSLTWVEGNYTLTLTAAASGITDSAGNSIQAGASDSWINTISALPGTELADNWIIQSNGAMFEAFQNIPAGPTPSYTATLADLSSLLVIGASGDDSLTIASALPFHTTFDGGTESDTLIVSAGAYELAVDASTLSIEHLAVTADGSVRFDASQHLQSLELSGNASAGLSPGGEKVLVTASLSVGNDATLDLADNDLVLLSTPETHDADLLAVTNLVAHARNANPAPWTAAGLTSTAAAADVAGLTGLAVVRNEAPGGGILHPTFDGEALDESAILVKFTWNGDADLSGSDDADDYFRIDSGFAAGDSGYGNGDFDYSGGVDADDYFLIDSAFGGQVGALAAPSKKLERPAFALTRSAGIALAQSPRKIHRGRHHSPFLTFPSLR